MVFLSTPRMHWKTLFFSLLQEQSGEYSSTLSSRRIMENTVLFSAQENTGVQISSLSFRRELERKSSSPSFSRELENNVLLSAPEVYWRIQFFSQLQEYTGEYSSSLSSRSTQDNTNLLSVPLVYSFSAPCPIKTCKYESINQYYKCQLLINILL